MSNRCDLADSSGDDHDYCEHTHPNHIREVTVKSFSSSTGIQRPGFQLLSLIPPPEYPAFPPEPTYADRQCTLPDQAGVYSRVYFPFICITILYIFFTNIRQAWIKWNAVTDRTDKPYGEKGRSSPSPSVEVARRYADRPVALTLPSRRSSAHLSTLQPHGGASTSRQLHMTSRPPSPNLSNRSAPVSPFGSPRPSFADEEADITLDTPNLSRRSSFIYMNGTSSTSTVRLHDPDRTPRVMSEPSSYFSSREPSGNAGLGLGLGLATPTGLNPYPGSHVTPNLRRTSSNTPSYSSHSPTPPPNAAQNRRVTMPRHLSAYNSDSDRESKKARQPAPNYLPVLSLTDGQNRSGFRGTVLSAWERLRGYMRWAWKMRNSVIVRSLWEVWGVAWVVAVAWVVLNGLFFLG